MEEAVTDEQLIFWAADAAKSAGEVAAAMWKQPRVKLAEARMLNEAARKLGCAAQELLNRARGVSPVAQKRNEPD